LIDWLIEVSIPIEQYVLPFWQLKKKNVISQSFEPRVRKPNAQDMLQEITLLIFSFYASTDGNWKWIGLSNQSFNVSYGTVSFVGFFKPQETKGKLS